MASENFLPAYKAMWADDSCAFKHAADQSPDAQGRINLLHDIMHMIPPGYSFKEQSNVSIGSGVNHTYEATITGTGGKLFYDLKVKEAPGSAKQIVDESPKDCR